MRITQNRFLQDRASLDLAFKMSIHGARQQTIRAFTGLSEDRVRKLSHSYPPPPQPAYRRRRQFRQPDDVTAFFQHSAKAFEASALASLFRLLDLLPQDVSRDSARPPANPMRWMRTYCDAYETYVALHSRPELSFEHGLFLLKSLLAADRIKIETCGRCGRLYLSEITRLTTAHCGCNARRLALPHRRGAAGSIKNDVKPTQPLDQPAITQRCAHPVTDNHVIQHSHADERE